MKIKGDYIIVLATVQTAQIGMHGTNVVQDALQLESHIGVLMLFSIV